MIHHGPLPERDFVIIRNEVVRDDRLSYRARGVLAYVLSHVSSWEVNAETLEAAAPNGEGREAVRAALRELEQAGYLVREKVQDPKTRRWATRLHWYGVSETNPQVEPTYGNPSVGYPNVGEPTTDSWASLEDHAEDHQEDEQSRAVAARSARSADEDGSDHRATVTEINDWREQDRILFRQHVGERLTSDGSLWDQGTWAVDQFYTAFRKETNSRSGKPIRWPGRFVEALRDVDDWLLDQGLERVEAA